MGMAASQARFLSITARLSDNELEQQSLAYSKQRLAENTERINDAYLDAMNKTQYQILTGYNTNQANYEDLTFNQLTGLASVASGKQYLVKANSGKVLVSNAVADAFASTNGDFNKFLAKLGYTQANIDVTDYEGSQNAIHEAWDAYLVSVGKSINDVDSQHILNFGYQQFEDSNATLDGYAVYNIAHTSGLNGAKINLYQDSNGYYKDNYKLEARQTVDETTGELVTGVYYQTEDQMGTDNWHQVAGVSYNPETEEYFYSDEKGFPTEYEDGNPITYKTLYATYVSEDEVIIGTDPREYLIPDGTGDFAGEISGNPYSITKESKPLNFEGATIAQRELYDYALAITEAYFNNPTSHTIGTLKYDANAVTYYKNIFNEIRTSGCTTVNEFDKGADETKLKEVEWFVKQLKAGRLTMSYYSTSEKAFVGTTLDSDESIVEKQDSAAMAIAEQVYQNQMDKLEHQDKQFDLQLNKLESEHNALQTELEAVQKVIKNNVEKSFNIFNA